ncbi:MAG TPA: FecR domain-containing protein [Spirochaetia bacterium]|nr:FecR domain-containing protein [Spirochaetia bacterium]
MKRVVQSSRLSARPGVPTFVLFFLLGIAATGFSQQAEVTYFQGTANLKSGSGSLTPVDFGTTMNAGDSIVTGNDGVVQLDQTGGSQITVQANSVFTLQKRYQDSNQQTVMTTVLGAVSYRFAKLAGSPEPAIATMSSVAGIRGTVFTVYAASDGTSRYEVTEGMVEVSSAGQSVDLTQNQAVEVAAGAVPGKVEALHGSLDYSKWNSQKEQDFSQNPVAALDAVGKQMDTFIAEFDKIEPVYVRLKSELDTNRAELKKLFDEGKKDEVQKLNSDKIRPLEIETTNAILTVRYWALSALSLRKYVMGRMFLINTLKHIRNLDDTNYKAFVDHFTKLDRSFRAAIVPSLVPLDI